MNFYNAQSLGTKEHSPLSVGIFWWLMYSQKMATYSCFLHGWPNTAVPTNTLGWTYVFHLFVHVAMMSVSTLQLTLLSLKKYLTKDKVMKYVTDLILEKDIEIWLPLSIYIHCIITEVQKYSTENTHVKVLKVMFIFFVWWKTFWKLNRMLISFANAHLYTLLARKQAIREEAILVESWHKNVHYVGKAYDWVKIVSKN